MESLKYPRQINLMINFLLFAYFIEKNDRLIWRAVLSNHKILKIENFNIKEILNFNIKFLNFFSLFVLTEI